MPSINLDGVSKKFGNLSALKDVDLSMEGPGCIGILGPNGAGKTTMLKIMTNIVRPNTGSAKINGISVSEFPAKALASVGALVEQPEFYPYLSAREILKFVARIKRVRGSLEDEISRVAELTAITSYLDRKAGELSKGMKQRLGIAVALVGDPDILILDEPTFGLDPSGMKRVRDLIKSLNALKEKIIILSTHLIYEAQEVCDRIIIINHGSVGYDTSNGKSDQMRIELESAADGVSLPSNLVHDYTVEGNNVYLRKNPGVENFDVISYFQSAGIRVKWVMPHNDLENIYVSLTKGR